MKRRPFLRHLPFVTVIAAGVMLAACEAKHPGPTNPIKSFAPKVVDETVNLPIQVRGEGELLAPGDRIYFERFIADYHMRGRQPLVIRMAAGDARAQRVRRALIKAGVRAREIVVLPPVVAGAQLSFMASAAQAPECGRWASRSSFNWTNRNQANFGCATQRNLGLTVSNPDDLERARPMSGITGHYGVRVITGEATGGGGDTGGGDTTGGTN